MPAKNFGIVHNTLGPLPGRYLSPFALATGPGSCCYNGTTTPLYDLSAWNQTYFDRLTDLVSTAAAAGVVVEFGLFSNMYGESSWSLSTLNPINNVNGVGKGANWTDMYSMAHADVTAVQLAFVQKVVSVLQPFDNVYYEVINEPYIKVPPNNITAQWQQAVAAAIVAADDPANRHVIQLNPCNYQPGCTIPSWYNSTPGIGSVSWHYAQPPVALQNYNAPGQKPFILNIGETGFSGPGDAFYRTEGWSWIFAGGATYINLDYSFSIYRPDGTDAIDGDPGGGSRALRTSLGALQRLANSLPLRSCVPIGGSSRVAVSGVQPTTAAVDAQALACDGVVGAYVRTNATGTAVSQLTLGTGFTAGAAVTVDWVNCTDGSALQPSTNAVVGAGGAVALGLSSFDLDVALVLTVAS